MSERNKTEVFKITNSEYDKILMYMRGMGITNKSEYFRLCILNPPKILRSEEIIQQDF